MSILESRGIRVYRGYVGELDLEDLINLNINVEIVTKKVRVRKEGSTRIYSVTIPKRWIHEMNLENSSEVKLVFIKKKRAILLILDDFDAMR